MANTLHKVERLDKKKIIEKMFAGGSRYRVNKHELLNILVERKCRLAIAFIYLSDQLVESSIIEDRMRIALVRIIEKMAAPNTDMPSTTLEP